MEKNKKTVTRSAGSHGRVSPLFFIDAMSLDAPQASDTACGYECRPAFHPYLPHIAISTACRMFSNEGEPAGMLNENALPRNEQACRMRLFSRKPHNHVNQQIWRQIMTSIINRIGSKSVPRKSGAVADENYGMDQLITRIAKSLVDQPENVMVTTVNGSQTMVLELRVAKEDVGKVIGKQGRTAQAMRMLLAAVSSKAKKRTVLEIIE
jgi:uncharacterized protein